MSPSEAYVLVMKFANRQRLCEWECPGEGSYCIDCHADAWSALYVVRRHLLLLLATCCGQVASL